MENTENTTPRQVGLIIAISPNKTEYVVGETFDPAGMEAEMLFSDGSRQTVTDFTWSPSGELTAADKTVTILYEGYSAVQAISVAEKQTKKTYKIGTYAADAAVQSAETEDIVSIEITHQPTKTIYTVGDLFVPAGIKVQGTTASGEKVDITAYEVATRGVLAEGENTIEIKYGSLTASLIVTARPAIYTTVEPPLRRFSLFDGFNADLNLKTGSVTAAFKDVAICDNALSFDISHVFRNDGHNKNAGNGWRLSLDQTLKAGKSGEQYIGALTNKVLNAGSMDYIYTDGNGNAYSLYETFYYVDKNETTNTETRVTVSDSDVIVEPDGKLYYVNSSNKKYEVTRELRTRTGLSLSTELDNIKGVEKLDQRHEEIAKLESEIQQYKDAIADLEHNIKMSGFAAENPDPPTGEAGVIFGFLGPAYGNDDDNLEERIAYAQKKATEYSVGESAYTEGLKEKRMWEVAKSWAFQKYGIDLNTQYDGLTDDEQKSYKQMVLERYKRQKEEYERTLGQLEVKLERYKLQVPVAYLTDQSGRTLCFNEFGNLCAILDGCDNYIAIKWDKIATNDGLQRAIKSVIGGEKQTTFEYNRRGLLSKIIEHNGRKISYTYNSNKQLTGVAFSNGKKLALAYDENGFLSKITSKSTGTRAQFEYTGNKLVGLTSKTFFATLYNDTIESEQFENKSYNNKIVESIIQYYDVYTTVASDNKQATYYFDIDGRVEASYATEGDKYIERPSFKYTTDTGLTSFSVRETGDAAWSLPTTINPSNNPIAVLTDNDLIPGETEYVFSAKINVLQPSSSINKSFSLSFGKYKHTIPYQCRLFAVINNSQTVFVATDLFVPGTHYLALPITISSPSSVNIRLYAQSGFAVNFQDLRLAPAEWEYELKDSFDCIKSLNTSEKQIAPNTYQSAETSYEYDKNHKLISERTTVTVTVNGAVNSENIAVKKYRYCEHGNLVKTESYIEGEENDKGVNVTERVCDERGNVIKEFSYNSLDSSTKFYNESVLSDKGVTTAEIDETGENKTELEYIDGTTTVKSQTLPSGSKLAYGYDERGNVTAITQSTDDGESNSTEIKYTLGCPTKLTSGNNTVSYAYDKKRRKIKVTVNGRATTYEYSGSKFDNTENVSTDEQAIGEITFSSVKADKVTATRDGVTAETYTDKNGNVVLTKIGGNVMTACNYNSDGQITESGDGITGSVKKFIYYPQAYKSLARVKISAGENVEELTEKYFYNSYGKLDFKEFEGAVEQQIEYFYKDNAARDLDHISLPSGLQYYPQTDVNGRNTGKELKNWKNQNVYGEYIYYRKVGDHGTNMPSSVYFGKTKNNGYSISDNIKYRYDEMGNISEIKENGVLTAKYTYDKIGRLIREDNRKFKKTTLWSYDNCGNILSKREAGFTLKPTDEIETFTDEKLYAYNGDKLLSFGDETLSYTDTDGNEHVNPLVYRGQPLSWNYERQLASFGENTFKYDGYGRRIKKNNTVFTYDANNKLIKQSDGTNTLEFIYDSSGLSGVVFYGKMSYIYSKDVQGNIVGILDRDGREVVQYSYDAWGNCKTTVLDEAHAAIAGLNPFRYRSYYYDTETHLYYLNTRYYDPEIGRFISQDDVSYLDPNSINGLNLFAYCGNNPVMAIDPNGTFAVTALVIGLIIGAIIGAIVGGTIAGCIAGSNGAKGWELFGWIMLGVFGGALIGGAIGAGLGAAAGAIFPGINAALAGSLSMTSPALMSMSATGSALAIGATTVVVPVGALATTGAVVVGVGVGAGIAVSFFKEHRKNARPSTRGRHQQGEANRKKDQWGEKGDKRRIRYRKHRGLIFILLDWLFDDEDE